MCEAAHLQGKGRISHLLLPKPALPPVFRLAGLLGLGSACRASCSGFLGIQKPAVLLCPIPVPCETRTQPWLCSTSMLNIGCILVYLKYWTLILIPLMVYPKVLFGAIFIVTSNL